MEKVRGKENTGLNSCTMSGGTIETYHIDKLTKLDTIQHRHVSCTTVNKYYVMSLTYYNIGQDKST